MFWKKEKEAKAEIQWNLLEGSEQLDQIVEESKSQPVLIYKHSTRCGISGMTMNRLERSWSDDLNKLKVYYLDLIAFRALSNEVANKFGVYHESPQVILIKEGNAIYDASHMDISTDQILANI